MMNTPKRYLLIFAALISLPYILSTACKSWNDNERPITATPLYDGYALRAEQHIERGLFDAMTLTTVRYATRPKHYFSKHFYNEDFQQAAVSLLNRFDKRKMGAVEYPSSGEPKRYLFMGRLLLVSAQPLVIFLIPVDYQKTISNRLFRDRDVTESDKNRMINDNRSNIEYDNWNFEMSIGLYINSINFYGDEGYDGGYDNGCELSSVFPAVSGTMVLAEGATEPIPLSQFKEVNGWKVSTKPWKGRSDYLQLVMEK